MRWNGGADLLTFNNQRVIHRVIRSVHDDRDQASVGVLERRAFDGAAARGRAHTQCAGFNEPREMPDVVVRRREAVSYTHLTLPTKA